MGAKMLKIGEFAARFGISDRHARRLFAQTESDIVGHFEKRGAAGTFLDDVAVEILRGKLTNPVEILPADAFDNVDSLKAEIAELQGQLRLKEEQLNLKNEQLAELALRVADVSAMPAMLETANSEKLALQGKNEELLTQMGSLEAQNAFLSSQNVDLSNDNLDLAEKLRCASEDLKTASEEVKVEQDKNHLLEQQIATMKKASLWRRIRGWRNEE